MRGATAGPAYGLRLVATSMLAVTLVIGVAAPPADSKEVGSKERKELGGEFVASQVPLASYMAAEQCDLAVGGIAHFPFEAPAEGVFSASMDGFKGDWDLWVTDHKGEYLTGSWNSQGWLGEQIGEQLSVPLEKGDRIKLIACNFDGEPEVTVRWKFRFVGFSDLLGGAALSERLPINFVFLGYEPRQIDRSAFMRKLPKVSQPIVRSRSWYGKQEGLGIRYSFDYNIQFAGDAYEDRFFGYLRKIGERTPPTSYQMQYNGQTKRTTTIEKNLDIDAAAVERWLGASAPAGIDTTQNTVFLINWFGRKDFSFHVYSLKDRRDSDTRFDWSADPSHKMIAWGGTPTDDRGPVRRVWFYDLSAGPDWRTQNWRVDAPPKGVMPPVWEYVRGGLKQPAQLTGDLAKVARYVAIDFFFTPSPLYPVTITPPKLPDKIDLDMNVYEGDRVTDASETHLDHREVLRELSKLQPHHRFTADEQDRDFFEGKQVECFAPHAAAWRAWPLFAAPSCYADRPYTSYSNLFLFSALNLDATADDRKSDYEATGSLYMTPEDNVRPPYLGLADDNHRDGTQSFIYVALPPRLKNYYGMTDVTIHEYGHHFGVSHTHDGYDFEDREEIGPYGKDTYLWVGDEVSSIMSYLKNTNGFSQFERDNMARFLAAAYLQETRSIAARVVTASEHSDMSALLELADADLARARAAFSAHSYQAAAAAAKEAYGSMLEAARRGGIRITASSAGTTPAEPGRRAHDKRIQNYYSTPVEQVPQPWLHEH